MAARSGDRTWRAHAKWAAVAVLLLLAAISTGQGVYTALTHRDGSIDLGIPLKAAQALMHENPYERFLAGETSSAYGDELNPFPMVAVHLPSALMLLWPYSGLAWPAAKVAWLVSNLLFTFGVLLLAFRRFLPHRPPWCGVAIGALLLMSLPWRVVIGNGQHLMMSLFFFLLAAELADRGHRSWAAVTLAASFLKYTVIIFLLPYFILKRQWAPLLGALGIHATMTLGISIWLREEPWVLIEQAIRGSRTHLLAGYVDLFAMANRIGAPLELAALLGVALTSVAVWIGARRIAVDENHYFAGLCILSVVIVYHRAYDAVILLIPLLVAVDQVRRDRLPAFLVFLLVGCSWFLDRLVIALMPWLGPRGDTWADYYHYLVALLFYATLSALLYWPMRPPRSTLVGGMETDRSAGIG